MSENNIHTGHRQRLKNEFLIHGLDPLNDVKVLELVLFYAIPQRDTNPIAHRLLDAFGSLVAIFDATPQELMERGGLSQNTATLIKLIPAVARRQQISKSSLEEILDTTGKCGNYIRSYFVSETEEVVYLLGLDAKCKALGCVRLFAGSINYVHLSVRKVVEAAISMKATTVVLAHNHPSGLATPSMEDFRTTMEVAKALDMVGVYLADHVIVADDDYVSMAESGFLKEGEVVLPEKKAKTEGLPV